MATNGEVIIDEIELEGETVYKIDNGKIKFIIPKTLAGNLLRLEDENGNTFLQDLFPKIQPKFFFEKYLGGIQPLIMHTSSNNLQPEFGESKSKIVQEGKWLGISSSLIAQLENSNLKGLEIETTFLTLPGSDLIRTKITLNNTSAREFQWIGTLFSDLAFNGGKEGLVIEAKGATKLWERNQIKKEFLSLGSFNEPYSRVKKGNQSISYIIPENTNGTSAMMDFVIMLVNWMLSINYAKPYSKSTSEYIIAVNQPREKLNGIRKILT
jgi:hypothetical protein